MADWSYALTQGIAGAAASGVQSLDEIQKQKDADAAANRELDVKVRLAAADQLLRQQGDDAKRRLALATGQAINTGATGLLNSAAAGSINAKFGSSIDPNNPDSAASLAAIRANPAAASAYGLPPEDDMTKANARAEAARNMGDTAAAAEEDRNVRNLVTDKRNEATDATTNRRLDQQQEWQQGQLERQTRLAEATLSYQQRMLASTDARAAEQAEREQRAATAKALDGAVAGIKALETESKDISTDDKRRAQIQQGLTSLYAEAAGYRRSLAGAGIAPSAGPTKTGQPPITAFDPDVGDVVHGFRYKGGNPNDRANWEPATTPQASSTAASAPVPKPGATGLLASSPSYTPPPDSFAAQAVARREALLKAANEKKQTEDQGDLRDALAAAQKALASRNPDDARAAQAMPAFSKLSDDTKTKIFGIAWHR